MKSVHSSTPVSRPMFNRIGTPPKQKAQEFFVFGVDAENRVWRIHVRGSMIGDEVELLRGMVQEQVTRRGGWGRRPKGVAPRSETSALGARWLSPARPQPHSAASDGSRRKRTVDANSHSDEEGPSRTRGRTGGSVRDFLLDPLVAEQQAESFGDGPGPDIATQRREVAVAE